MDNISIPTGIFYQSNLDILTDVPVDPDVNHVLYFASDADRDNYFNSHIYKSWTDFKYIREDNRIKVKGIETEFYHCNYMRFRNNETGGMWVYAFIINTEYINSGTTALHYKIDPWQTYYSSLEIRNCDIDRMHVSDTNSWQKYTIPEGLELCDYTLVVDNKIAFSAPIDGCLIMSTIDLVTSGGTVDNPEIYSGKGCYYNGSPCASGLFFTENITAVMNGLSEYPWVAQGIIGIYPMSSKLINGGVETYTSKMGFSIGVVVESHDPYYVDIGYGNIIDSFPTVKNKKLYTYPYTYIEIVAPNGNKITLKPELLPSSGVINLQLICTLIPTPAIHVDVSGYMGSSVSDLLNASITFNQFPSYPCINDRYTVAKEQAQSMENLIASQNKFNLERQGIGGFGAIIGSGFGGLGNVVSTTVNEVSSLASSATMEQQRAERSRLSIGQMTTAPSLVGNNSGSACAPIFSKTGSIDFLVRVYSVIPKQRENIDSYFTAYGYKLNEIKTPDLSAGGRRYKYIKCNHVNIYGNIPQEFLSELRAMFMTGITLWYDHTNVGVY